MMGELQLATKGYTDIEEEIKLLRNEATSMSDDELITDAVYKSQFFKDKKIDTLLNSLSNNENSFSIDIRFSDATTRGLFEQYYVLTEGRLGMKI